MIMLDVVFIFIVLEVYIEIWLSDIESGRPR